MRILIVEDHAETRKMVERVLREAGHDGDGVGDLAAARGRLAAGGYAAVVLDWMLPDGAGTDLCREMRARGSSLPVLILTARGGVEDRVEGLDAGADDYLRKPFAVAELLARVRALLRRGPRIEAPVVSLGEVEVRLAERRVLVRGREAPLTAREFAILEVLLQAVWGEESDSAESSLEVLIGRMRRKLSPLGGDGPIETHRGFGYSIGQDA